MEVSRNKDSNLNELLMMENTPNDKDGQVDKDFKFWIMCIDDNSPQKKGEKSF